MILELASAHELLVTWEEHVVQGGAGSAVNECLAAHGVAISVLNLGLPDRFVEHGTREEMLRDAALDREGITAALKRYYLVDASYANAAA
jgi:1-deoxy-D-xylulose-5-phosphate synthase